MVICAAEKRYAVAVLVEAPEGIPLVMDKSKPEPHYWKMPGGTNEHNETPEQTGERELEEETGVILPEGVAEDAYEEPRKGHNFHIIRATIPFLKGIKETGKEGEIVCIFTREQMQILPNLMPAHRKALEYIGFLRR